MARTRSDLCVYCWRAARTTDDHVFARSFLLERHRANNSKVDACGRCNNDKSKLEMYLATVLPFGGYHADARETLTAMVPKRLAGNARLHRTLAGGMSRYFLRNHAGLMLPTLAIPFDGGKLESLFAYIVKGLAWHHWTARIDADCFVTVNSLTAHGGRVFQAHLRRGASAWASGNIGDGAFRYRGIQGVDNPQVWIWTFQVYGGVILTANDPRHGQTLELGAMTGPMRIAGNARRKVNAGRHLTDLMHR